MRRGEMEGGATQAAAASRPPAVDTATPATSAASAANGTAAASLLQMSKHEVGRRLFQRVALVNAAQAAKITGMLLELPDEELWNF